MVIMLNKIAVPFILEELLTVGEPTTNSIRETMNVKQNSNGHHRQAPDIVDIKNKYISRHRGGRDVCYVSR